MSGPGQHSPHPYHHQQHHQQPPPPQPSPSPGHTPPPAHGWIDSSGRWQPGGPPPPQPPKKSSNGVVVTLAIIGGVLALGVIGLAVNTADDSPSVEEEALADLSERLDERGDEFGAINTLTDELIDDEVIGLNGLESRCVATQIVGDLGADRSLEISAADVDAGLPLAEAEAFGDAYVDCVDLRALFGRAIESDPESAGLPDFYVDCLFDEIGEMTFRTEIVADLSGEATSDADLEQLGADAGDRCIESFTPEQLEVLANG